MFTQKSHRVQFPQDKSVELHLKAVTFIHYLFCMTKLKSGLVNAWMTVSFVVGGECMHEISILFGSLWHNQQVSFSLFTADW